jgi:hypothetical protein
MKSYVGPRLRRDFSDFFFGHVIMQMSPHDHPPPHDQKITVVSKFTKIFLLIRQSEKSALGVPRTVK